MVWPAVAVLLLSWPAAAAMPMPAEEEVILLAADVPAKGKRGRAPLPARSKEELKQRGAELGNFVYEIYDPNAPDPLAELDLEEPRKPFPWRPVLWITGGAAVLAGAGTAGYFLLNPIEELRIRYIDMCASGSCPGN